MTDLADVALDLVAELGSVSIDHVADPDLLRARIRRGARARRLPIGTWLIPGAREDGADLVVWATHPTYRDRAARRPRDGALDGLRQLDARSYVK